MTCEQLEAKPACRIKLLIAEDEMVVAMSLECLLDVFGHRAIMAGRLSQALEIAETAALDGALLDVNLGGDNVYPLAEALDRRHIPFVFMTGYSANHIDARWRDRPVVEKPFDPDKLEQLIDTIFNREPNHSRGHNQGRPA